MIPAEDWLDATTKSLLEVANTYFDLSTMEAGSGAADAPKCGAMIGLASEDNTVQLMLISTRLGSESLGRALLGFDSDEAIETGDLADAIGEIVNIVAGMVKTAVHDQDDALNLTLPTFFEGTVEPLAGQVVLETMLKIGPVETRVVVSSGVRRVTRKPRSSAA